MVNEMVYTPPTKEELEAMFRDNLNKEFNGGKTAQDRKYFIYYILTMLVSNWIKVDIKIEKMIGSNQVLVYKKEEIIYNSNFDNGIDVIKFLIEKCLVIPEKNVVTQ
jgi:hypothetical protein